MRFSLFYNFDALAGKEASELYREVEAQAIIADQLGFDALWLAERHFERDGSMPSPLLSLARISSLTRSIELGTTVGESSYYHPLRLAETTALLDIISGGRVRLGIGSAVVNKRPELMSFDIALDAKTAHLLELLSVLRQAFDEGRVDFVGHYYHYAEVELLSRPLQSARQLIWIAANHATPELAGVAGYSLLIPEGISADTAKQFLARYRAHLDGKSGFVAQFCFISIAKSEREAQEQMQRLRTRHHGRSEWDGRTECRKDAEPSRHFNVVIGTPDHVAEQLLVWQQAHDMNEIICQVYAAGMRHEDARRTITLLGQEVLPRLQSHQRPVITPVLK